MLIYEYKLDAASTQYARIDAAIRVGQFVRNKCLRLWIDGRGRRPGQERADARGRVGAGMGDEAGAETEPGMERRISANDLQVYCRQLAQDYAFAACLNSQARQAAADRAWQAIHRFYQNCRDHRPGKKGYPQFQRNNRSVEYKQTGWKLDADGKHLTLTDGCQIGRVRLIGTRDIATFPTNQIKRVRLVRRADGYYAQFVVQAERHIAHVPTGKPIGIDVGLAAYTADSDGVTVDNPRFLRRSEQWLQLLSRRLSRKSVRHKAGKKPKQNHSARRRARHNKYPPLAPRQTRVAVMSPPPSPMPSAPVQKYSMQKQSANWHKARLALAKRHLTIQRQREDFARKQANALVSSHDLIALEDLQVRNLVKNRRLAKSISDAGWASFRRWVEYYGMLHGIPVVAVPPHFTSQDCSRCGRRVPKSLSVRTHICPRCGLLLDRDQNAARNILTKALAVALGRGIASESLLTLLAAPEQDYNHRRTSTNRTVGHTGT